MPSILNTVRDLDRLRQIVTVLTKHGFGEAVQRTGLGSLITKKGEEPKQANLAHRIRAVLQDLGPSFIKLGQVISTRPDLIPTDIIEELKELQDNVPPEPFETIQSQVEAELGAPIADIFESFEEAPLASASIGQVHRAKLKVDTQIHDVVVKVQRPKAQATIERDLDLLYWFAHAAERSLPELKAYSPVKLVNEFDRAIKAELDYTQEADNAEQFAKNFENDNEVRFPKVYRKASSRKVLTLEFLDGLKINQAILNGASGKTITQKSVRITVKQIFEDGFFHADPHPGNVFILGDSKDPILGMIDLGLIGRLSPQLRDRCVDLMIAALQEDHLGIADALYAIGRSTKKVDRKSFEADVANISQRYLGKKLQDIELGSLISDLVSTTRKHQIEIPPDFLMMAKALVTIEGVGKEIYPELDLFEEARPYFFKLLYQRFSPERIGQDTFRGAMRFANMAKEMPLQAQQIMDDLRKGAFRVETEHTDLPHLLNQLGRRFVSGMISASLIGTGGILLASDKFWFGAIAILSGFGWYIGHGILFFLFDQSHRK